MTPEQKDLHLTVSRIIGNALLSEKGLDAADISAAIAVALERAAEVAATCHVGWPMDGREQRNVCAAAIRALIHTPKPADLTTPKGGVSEST